MLVRSDLGEEDIGGLRSPVGKRALGVLHEGRYDGYSQLFQPESWLFTDRICLPNLFLNVLSCVVVVSAKMSYLLN